jgi:hypothetical protein
MPAPETLPPAVPLDSKDLHELEVLLFEHIEHQISFADTKAQLTLTAGALLAAGMAVFGQGSASALLDSTAPLLTRLNGLLIVLMVGMLTLSVYYALLAARPNFTPPAHGKNLFFFGHIVQFAEPDFVRVFSEQTEEQVHAALLSQVYAKSRIANRKFLRVRHSLNFLVGAFVLWAGAQLLLVLAG